MLIDILVKYIVYLFLDFGDSYSIQRVIRISRKELVSHFKMGFFLGFGKIKSIDLTQRDDGPKIDISNMKYFCKILYSLKNENS